MRGETGPADAAIEAIDLTKSYGRIEAVRGIRFHVRRGECFGFLGPNGAGKSTTMRMIYRACPLGGGSLTILGLDVGDGRNDRRIKRRLGVVPQEYNLDERLSARENLAVFARFHRLRGTAARERTDRLLDEVGVADRADVPVELLSGGQKRRVQIARGLIGTPEILVLDEPTTGLDPQARNRLWDHLVALRRRATTLVLTTHYMDEAEKLCDRLVIMDEGRIAAEGSPAELIAAHVAPHVIELRLDDDAEMERARRSFAADVENTGRLAERLLLYTRDGDDLLRRVAPEWLGCQPTLRRSNLEDVFLRLTGHGLEAR